MDDGWTRYVPRRLRDTHLKYRKQLWYIRPAAWSEYHAYIHAHEAMVDQNALEGGIGVMVYDLSGMTLPANWMTIFVPFAEMHQRLHRRGHYDKWLVKTFIIAPNEMIHAALTAVLSGAWQPTRPTQMVESLDELSDYLATLWAPRA